MVMYLQAPPMLVLLAAGVGALLLGLLTPLLETDRDAYFSIANLAASLAVPAFRLRPQPPSRSRGPTAYRSAASSIRGSPMR